MNIEARHILNGRDLRRNKQVSSGLLTELAECAPEAALTRLDTTRSGLPGDQIEARLQQYGLNEVTHERPPSWYDQLFHAFLTPFNGVLFTVSIVSLFSDVILAAPEDRSFRTIIVLISMVLLSTLLRFWQEFRSNKAAEELKAMVSSTTAVLRAGMSRPQEMPISKLVPGGANIVIQDCRAEHRRSADASRPTNRGVPVMVWHTNPKSKRPECRWVTERSAATDEDVSCRDTLHCAA